MHSDVSKATDVHKFRMLHANQFINREANEGLQPCPQVPPSPSSLTEPQARTVETGKHNPARLLTVPTVYLYLALVDPSLPLPLNHS